LSKGKSKTKEFYVRHAASSQSYDVMETSEYIKSTGHYESKAEFRIR